MKSLRSQSGQALVLSVVFLVALLGIAAFVLDVGSWFRADRHAQSTADAAALAGAQALPYSTSDASALANQYADSNGGGDRSISFSTQALANDTIEVGVSRPAPGFFSKIFGIGGVTVHASATARTGQISQARRVAPMVVSKDHPQLVCRCWGAATSLPYDDKGAPGAFGMLNLNGGTGTVGSSTEAQWISRGFDQYLGLGDYKSDPGAKFSSGVVQDALASRIGTELLFPVYSALSGQGQNALYTIIGWVGFHLTSFDVHGNNAELNGYFTQVIWDGIQASTAQPDYGVRAVSLVG